MSEPTPTSALELPHAVEAERLVMARGNLFCVTGPAGNIVPKGARQLGLFHEDTRHLSYYELVLLDQSTVLLSSETAEAVVSQIDVTVTGPSFGGTIEQPQNFLHLRRKQLLSDELVDQLAFTNYLGHAAVLEFELRFDADFADVFEVRGAVRPRRGQRLEPRITSDSVELSYLGTDGISYGTELRFQPEPLSLDAKSAHFCIRLAPGESQVQEIVIAPFRARPRADRPMWPFDVRLARSHHEASEFRAECTHLGCDNALLLRALDHALADIYALRVSHEQRWILGAGIPWFAAPFGRDSIITSVQMLAFAPRLAVETLRFLAAYQGKQSEPTTEEEPGKIMHELRRGEMVRVGEIPHSPYYGSVDATPLYVVLAGETYRFTADEALLQEIWPNVVAAMDWIERETSTGTKLLTYHRRSSRGLENQGWKDSRDGVSHPDGRRAEPPIALVEVQGYVIDAYRQGAYLASLRGEEALAQTWRSRIEPFERLIEESFWNERTQFYALAIDGGGRQVSTITSNPGHLLWSRAISSIRAQRVAQVLLSPEVYSGWGIRTVGRGQSVYNPLSYHNGSVWPHDNALAAMGMARYGLRDSPLRLLEGMFGATEHFRFARLPELFCGMGRGDREFLVHYPVSCSPQGWASGALFMLLHGVLGLDPDASAGRLRIWNPRLPRHVRRLDLLGMRVGGSQVSIRFIRSGKRTHTDVLDAHGAPLRVQIEVD